jgi:hypothetical protein
MHTGGTTPTPINITICVIFNFKKLGFGGKWRCFSEERNKRVREQRDNFGGIENRLGKKIRLEKLKFG